MGELDRALAVAVEAALRAGAMIRDEFHRQPDGPRGRWDHADVDDEAEIEIRAALLRAFPDWGYRGEETGSANVDPPPRYIWLVDPNDGTTSFLQGYRGNAVSIALLRDQQPVLGVVYAPSFPDDDGDLYTWADGSGPATRNGQPLPNVAQPRSLGPHEILAISADADNVPLKNAKIIDPARNRPMPSIAYRLAMAAAGDVTIGAALKGAGDWDYAAGHALLRGVGADMFDHQGNVVMYSPQGESHCRACFGGPVGPIHPLLTRPYRDMYPRQQRRDPSGLLPPHTSLRPGYHVREASLLRRAQGCLLGQLAGDALGSAVEFQTPAAIRQGFPQGVRDLIDGGTFNTLAGQPTDDSEMALALARSIERSGGYDLEIAARAYGYWLQSGPFDLGTTTATALGALPPIVMPLVTRGHVAHGHKARMVGSYAAEAARHAANAQSQANGSLMRVSPLGIWGYAMDPDDLADVARADSQLTHPNAVCQEACAVYVVAIAHAIATGPSAREAYTYARQWAERACREPAVLDALVAAERSAPADYMTNQGWVLVALQNAFYQLLHAESAELGIADTVMAGGDTDTNAAIAGALLGAVHGRESIPARWRSLILTCRPIQGAPGVHRPRPEPFWPVDALELSERLLLAGRK